MKKMIFLALALCMTYFAQAQVKFGVRAGLSTTDVSPNELLVMSGESWDQLKLSVKEANYGVHFGLVTQIQIKRFFLQPELLFTSNNTDFQVTEFKNGTAFESIRNESYQYLDFPIMAGLKFGPLRLQGGPVGHVFLDSKSELLDIDGIRTNFDKMQWGWQAGVGLDIWKFMVDVKYEGQFNNYGDHLIINDDPYRFDEKAGRFVATLGFTF